MIINPVIPIWLMSIISIIAIILIIYNSQLKDKILNKLNNSKRATTNVDVKKNIISLIIKIAVVILLFIINLRFMVPNGESMAMTSDTSILFVIDTSVSMGALDYDGNKKRFEGVINDCCYIVDELSSCKFSIITFGDIAKKIIPFTYDTDMVQAELKAIQLEDENYAKGSSMNLARDILEKTVKAEKEREKEKGSGDVIVFFITDGEITKEGEKLESFTGAKQNISNGAVLGYGTTEGGKMRKHYYKYTSYSDADYITYDEDGKMGITAISKIDEKNLKQISNDLGIDYIKMNKQSNINYKISDIKKKVSKSLTEEQKISTYKDIYYYFAIPLAVLLVIDLAIKKKKLYM